jgi:hypothetical protein
VRPSQAVIPGQHDEDDLTLPPTDGKEGDEVGPDTQDELAPLAPDTDPDALGDSVLGEEGLVDDVFGREESLLEGTEEAGDAGGFGDGVEGFSDAGIGADDEPSRVDVDDAAFTDPDSLPAIDGGEEGFEGEDDAGLGALPDMDADDEGAANDVPVAEIDAEPDLTLPWDDRAFERVAGPLALGAVRTLAVEGEIVVAHTDDSVVEVSAAGAVLARRSTVGPPHRSTPRKPALAGSTAEVTWAGGVLAAIYSEVQGRAWLVRSAEPPEDKGRIVADVTDDAGELDPAPVEAMVVEPSRGWVWVGGAFGLLAYRRR